MLRSLFSGVSGLRNHQTRMDVIGNNIANVNTVAYKTSQVNFKDTFSQTLRGASAPVANSRGGTNPMQVGLGMSIANISVNHTQGSLQATGKTTDLAIEGDGYFILQDSNNELFYTRAGNFELDANGDLVSATNGYRVLGTNNLAINIRPDEIFTIDQSGTVSVIDANGNSIPRGTIGLASFSNPSGLLKTGDNMYSPSNNSGTAQAGAPGLNGRGTIIPGALEMSNVDLSQEFTDMIITQRGFQANSRIITTSDEILNELVNLKR